MFDTHVPTKRVLIVDDEYVPRSLESFALEGTGRYYTFEAANATDALTALAGEEFDCAVIDMSMPDMSGVELIAMIRRDPARGRLPIVLVMPEGTAVGGDGFGGFGADRVVAKPLQPFGLARLLDTLTGDLEGADKILSVESVLRGFPFPTMILDEQHRVLLANGAFYDATDTGIGECYVFCNEQLHGDKAIPAACPLDECVATGQTAEHTIETALGTMRVSVYPLEITTGDGDRLFLHVTQPQG